MGDLFAALALAAARPAQPPGDLSRRIVESAAAAQALQGPLDGAWRVVSDSEKPLLLLQITDHAGGGPLSAAWREPDGGTAPAGVAEPIQRADGVLNIDIQDGAGGGAVHLRLRKRGPRLWEGWLASPGRRLHVKLEPMR